MKTRFNKFMKSVQDSNLYVSGFDNSTQQGDKHGSASMYFLEGERERVSKRASEQAAERASERASERDRVAQGRWSESGTLSRRAAAAGLAPDVKFSCGKAQLYFTV